MAIHNRPDFTLKSIQSLLSAAGDFWDIQLFVANSGAPGIENYISKMLPSNVFHYTKVPEDSFWAESMHKCFSLTRLEEFDFVLLLNNDVFLNDNAAKILRDCAKANANCLIVGQLWDPIRNSHSYGGLCKIGRHPLHFKSVIALNYSLEADALQGNCVLVPISALANGLYLDPAYRQNYADLDFGIRARGMGYKIIIAPGYVGECENGIRIPARNFRERISEFNSPLGTPVRAQIKILKQASSSKIWWVWLLPPIIRLLTGKSPKFLSK